MASCLSRISSFYPCRTQQITELFECVGRPDEQYPQAIYVYGQACTGKSKIIQALLRNNNCDYAIVNCTECFSLRVLVENIVDNLRDHVLSESNGFNSFTKCDSLGDLIHQLRLLPEERNVVLVFENADYLRDLHANVLPGLMRLQELTGRNICSVLVSQLPYEKFYPKTGIPEIVRIRFPQYTAGEVATILQKDYEGPVKAFVRRVIDRRKDLTVEEKKRYQEILNLLDQEFYANYLHAFLCVFFRACRNVSQLRLVAKECFAKYCEPIFIDPDAQRQVTKLWHNVSDTLKETLAHIYSRIEAASEEHKQLQQSKQAVQVLELPYYAKFLLVAGFLSSHNPASQDKRLFVKNHGKQRKRMQAVNAKAKLGEQTSLQQGPKSFTIDRLLAIFHAILDQKVTLTCNLMAQISSLVQLNFFVYVANETNVVEGAARLQCFLTYEFATQIGEMVGFNVRQYLFDLI